MKAIQYAASRPAAAPNSARNSGIWASKRTNALKSVLASARNPTQGPPPQSIFIPGSATPSDVAGRMNKLDLRGPASHNWRSTDGPYNPSLGPTGTAMTTKSRETTAPSHTTDHSSRHAFQNAVCKLSNYTRKDFKLGDVIAAPFHVANTNPHVDPRDDRLTLTREGPAYSKRRMMIVLFLHQTDLFCLPLYSFSGLGIREKPDALKTEFVCVCNVGAQGFVNHGVHPVVEIAARRPVDDTTTVHLSGGLRVGFSEDVTRVGRLTRQSYFDLVEIWKKLVGKAEGEVW